MAPHQPIPPRCDRLPTNLMSTWCWTVGCVWHQTGIKFLLCLAPNLIPIWCQTTGFALRAKFEVGNLASLIININPR